MQAHIYIVTNKLNGKQYVGQTTVARNKVGHGLAMTEAYVAYGKDNFVYEHICDGIDNRNTLNAIEKFWIATCGTIAPNGYNIEAGGSDKGEVAQSTRQKMSALLKGRPMKEETKEKIRQALMGEKNHFYGKKHTNEALEKIGKASIGRVKVLSEETKQNLRELRVGEKNPMYGKKHTDETKAKFKYRPVAKAWLGKKMPDDIKQKMSESHKNKPQLQCPHCNKIGGSAGMKVHHFENCKQMEIA